MAVAQVLEGTWEEILPQADEAARRMNGGRLKVIIMPQEPARAASRPDLPKPKLSWEERSRRLDELAERNRGFQP